MKARFYKKKVDPRCPVNQFIVESDIMLQNVHDIPIKNQHQQRKQHRNISYDNLVSIVQSSQSQNIHLPNINKKRNYDRTVKRLKK